MARRAFIYRIRGYTLIELLVVISVVAILVSLGYKSIGSYLQHNESMKTRSDLQNFLTTGKQFSLIYQSPISLCVANENKQCVTQDGTMLLTFIDKDNSGGFTSADTLLEIHKLALKYAYLVTSIALAKPYIIFTAQTGRPTGYMGHIKYCPVDGNPKEMFKVTFSKTAVIKIKTRQEENTDC